MFACLVKNKIVIDVIVVDDIKNCPSPEWIECPEWIGIGMNIDTPNPATPSPTQVSMRQARLALFHGGLLDQVQTAINSMNEPTKTTTQISWDYATVVNRDDDLVIQLSTQLNLTSDDLDALFARAITL